MDPTNLSISTIQLLILHLLPRLRQKVLHSNSSSSSSWSVAFIVVNLFYEKSSITSENYYIILLYILLRQSLNDFVLCLFNSCSWSYEVVLTFWLQQNALIILICEQLVFFSSVQSLQCWDLIVFVGSCIFIRYWVC